MKVLRVDGSRHLWEMIAHEEGVIRSKQRSEEHTSELQSRFDLVCRLLLEKKNTLDLFTHPLTATLYTLSLHDALPILTAISSTGAKTIFKSANDSVKFAFTAPLMLK